MKFFFVSVLFFLISWPVFADSLPPALAIRSKIPQTLEDVEALLRYRWFEEAWKALESYPQTDEKVLSLKAQSLIGQKKYEAALTLYSALKENEATLLGKAKALSRLKRYEESVQVYEKLFSPSGGRRKDRYRWMAFKTALEGRLYFEGLRLLQGLKGEKALWWRGWCHFRLQEEREALRNWEKILPRRLGKIYYPKVLYWKAHILQQLGSIDESQILLHRLLQEYPGKFYGFLALWRIYPEKEQKRIFEEIWSDFPKEEGALRIAWEERFPKTFGPFVFANAKKNHIDPYLIFALIKQESLFREEALSAQGAMGLMQLLPQTALQLAKVSHDKHFSLTDIFDPKTNIRLGSFYLRFLKQLFDDDLPSLIASYNAGEEAVSRWLKIRKGESPLFFIEEIPYEETQNYTQKVLTHYWVYHWLYEGKLPLSNLSTPSKTAMR